MTDLSVAILAGGRSSRMGRDKGLVPLGGRPMVEHVLQAAGGLGREVFLVTNRPRHYAYLGLRMVRDENPGRGSLEGLRKALAASRAEAVLVLGCDLPFLHRPLLEWLVRREGEFEALVPRAGGRLQPFAAVYRRACLPQVEAALARGEMRIRDFLHRARVEEVDEAQVAQLDPEGLSFFNVNFPADLEEAERRLGTSKE